MRVVNGQVVDLQVADVQSDWPIGGSNGYVLDGIALKFRDSDRLHADHI